MKALVLCSGGVDSTTCLAMAVAQYGRENVRTLCIFYGQKHDKELKAAQAVADYYGVEHQVLNLAALFEGSDCSLLQGSSQVIPHETYAAQLQKQNGQPVSTYVPFRNGLFLSAAASIALSHDCSVIYYGAHSDDAAGNAYPDCSAAFNQAMAQAIFLGSGEQLRVEAPLIGMNKAQVVAQGLSLHAPYHLTWSCYEGGDTPCGQCGTCRDRQAAFAANGVPDPATETLTQGAAAQ